MIELSNKKRSKFCGWPEVTALTSKQEIALLGLNLSLMLLIKVLFIKKAFKLVFSLLKIKK